MKLSPHFTLAEMTISQAASRKGLNNTPTALQVESLRLLCTNVIEPLRVAVRRPIIISSGYRSVTVNKRIGGSPKSQHCRGEAVDFTIPGMSVAEVVALIRKMELPVDQCIDEFSAWVHCSHATTGKQRGQYLTARRIDRKVVYSTI